MKKAISIIAIVGISFASFMIGMSVKVMTQNNENTQRENNNLYPLTTRVIQIDEDSDCVSIEDCNGNLYSFIGIEEWETDMTCTVIMDSKGTKTIYDDEIVSVRYSSFSIGKGEN